MPAKTNTRVFSINDFLSWYDKGELNLSPNYQRKSNLWNMSSKSYFIDTLLRGFPIPPIYIRQITDVVLRKTTREVIDGQQRLSTIFAFLNDEFSLSALYNSDFANKKYSELDKETKGNLLDKELAVEIVASENESDIAEIFVRINSTNYILNAQELRNAQYQNDFKVMCNNLANKYRNYFLENEILTKEDTDRMLDVELISKMMFVILEGDKDLTQESLNALYARFNDNKQDNDFFLKQEEFLSEILDKMKEKTNLSEILKKARKSVSAQPNFLISFYLTFKGFNKNKNFQTDKCQNLCNFFSKGYDIIITFMNKIQMPFLFDEFTNTFYNFNPIFINQLIKIGSTPPILEKIMKFPPEKAKRMKSFNELFAEFFK